MQISPPTRTIDGIVFTRGENDCQYYWETEHQGIYYAAIQPKGLKHWAIVAVSGKTSQYRTSRLLNGSVRIQLPQPTLC